MNTSQFLFHARCLSASNPSKQMFCFLLLGGKAVMETSIFQINTGGEALLCLLCCKHESIFILVECEQPARSRAHMCTFMYERIRLLILTL